MAVALYSTGYRPCHTGSSGHRSKILHRDRSQKLASRKHQNWSPRQDGGIAALKDEGKAVSLVTSLLRNYFMVLALTTQAGTEPVHGSFAGSGQTRPGAGSRFFVNGRIAVKKRERANKKALGSWFCTAPEGSIGRREWGRQRRRGLLSPIKFQTCSPVSASARHEFLHAWLSSWRTRSRVRPKFSPTSRRVIGW